MKAAGKNLAEKDSIQITADSGKGDREYYKKDPDQDSQSTVYKTSSCLTKSMQDARKRCVQIKKRADERKRLYVGPGSRTVKQYCPHKWTDTVKTKRAQKSKQTYRIRFRYPSACISATEGMSIMEAEFVIVAGKRIHGSASPVKIP